MVWQHTQKIREWRKKNLRRRASVLQSLGFVYCMLSSNLASFLKHNKETI